MLLGFWLGVLCVVLSAAATVVFTLIVQLLGKSNSLNQPFLEVYFNHAIWVIVLPVAFLWFVLVERKRHRLRELPWKRLLIWSLTGGPLLIFGAFSYYLSLTRTSLVVSNSIQNSVFVLVFVLSLVFLQEKATFSRIVGIIVCVGGVVLLAFGSTGLSDGDPEFSWMGGAFLLVALVFGAAYSVLYSWLFREENVRYGNSPVISLFAVALIGCSTLCLMWSGILIGAYSGLEPFAWPTLDQLKVLLFNASMDLILNFTNLLAILFIGPSLTTVGLLLAVPLSVVVQALYLHSSLAAMGYGGCALILLGCLVFYVGDELIVKVRDKYRAPDEETKQLIQ